MYPVIIPSKSRPFSTIFRELPDATIVVEPQEVATYRRLNPAHSIVVLPENNRGLAYSRQFILDMMRQQGVDWFWMIDDDVKYTYRVENGETIKEPIKDVLASAEIVITAVDGVALGALEYSQYAWGQKKPYALNSYCDVCVLLNASCTEPARYRLDISLKEDRDFAMQVIASGALTMRTSKFAFHSPKNGQNSGGLQPLYRTPGYEDEVCQRVVDYWGHGFCNLQTKKTGRRDLKINWRALTRLGAAERFRRETLNTASNQCGVSL